MNKNRSASRFFIVTSAYLFLMLLVCSIQALWSIKPHTEVFVWRDVFFLPAWIAIALAAVLSNKINATKHVRELVNTKVLFWIVVASVVYGFFLAINEQNTVIVVLKCISNGISLLLLIFGYVFSTKKIGKLLLIIELLFWTMKSLLYYRASPDLVVAGYFLLSAWVLRALFIVKVLHLEKRRFLK